jgi:hypothetical protein
LKSFRSGARAEICCRPLFIIITSSQVFHYKKNLYKSTFLFSIQLKYHYFLKINSEFGWEENFNVNTVFIDFFAWIGWAYDLKRAPREIIIKRKERTGELVEENIIKDNAILDWIYGFFLSSIALWILLPLRAIYHNLLL